MKVAHMWVTFNSGSVAEWEFTAETENECLEAAYARKEAIRGTEQEWMEHDDHFVLYDDSGTVMGEFYL